LSETFDTVAVPFVSGPTTTRGIARQKREQHFGAWWFERDQIKLSHAQNGDPAISAPCPR